MSCYENGILLLVIERLKREKNVWQQCFKIGRPNSYLDEPGNVVCKFLLGGWNSAQWAVLSTCKKRQCGPSKPLASDLFPLMRTIMLCRPYKNRCSRHVLNHAWQPNYNCKSDDIGFLFKWDNLLTFLFEIFILHGYKTCSSDCKLFISKFFPREQTMSQSLHSALGYDVARTLRKTHSCFSSFVN